MPAAVALVEAVLLAATVGLVLAGLVALGPGDGSAGSGGSGGFGGFGGSGGPGAGSDPAPAVTVRTLVAVVLFVSAATTGWVAFGLTRRSLPPSALVFGIGWPAIALTMPLAERTGTVRAGEGGGLAPLIGSIARDNAMIWGGMVGWGTAGALAVVLVLRSGDARRWLLAGSSPNPSRHIGGEPVRRWDADPVRPRLDSRPIPRRVNRTATGMPMPAPAPRREDARLSLRMFRIVCAPADEGIADLIRAGCREAGWREAGCGEAGCGEAGCGEAARRPVGLFAPDFADQPAWTFVLITHGVDWPAMEEAIRRAGHTAVCVLGSSVSFARDTNTLSRSQWIDLREQRPAAMRRFFAHLAGDRSLEIGAHVPPSRYDSFRAPAAVRRVVGVARTYLAITIAGQLGSLLARPDVAMAMIAVLAWAVGAPLLATLAYGASTRRLDARRIAATAVAACAATAGWAGVSAVALYIERGQLELAGVLYVMVAVALPGLLAGDVRLLRRSWLPRRRPYRSRLLTPVFPGFGAFYLPLTCVVSACLAYSAYTAG